MLLPPLEPLPPAVVWTHAAQHRWWQYCYSTVHYNAGAVQPAPVHGMQRSSRSVQLQYNTLR